MKFRNIITLLFAVTVFSSAYSMGDLPGSFLSREVDLDNTCDCLDLYSYLPTVSRENLDIQSDFILPESLALQRLEALKSRSNRSKRNLDEVRRRYKRYKSNITEFHTYYVRNSLNVFYKNKETYSEEEFEQFIDKGYGQLVDAVLNIDMLRKLIIDSLPQELSSRLISVLDSVRLEIRSVCDIYILS